MSNIEEDIKKVSERFNNGTETIEDILKYCRNFKFTFENGIKLQLVEKKYLDRLIKEYKNLLAEREEDKKRIKELEVLEDDLKDKRIVYVDTAEFKENSIPKQKVINSINYYDERIKHAKLIKDKEQEEFYIDIKRAFYKLLEDK